jgi:hypothetical protein
MTAATETRALRRHLKKTRAQNVSAAGKLAAAGERRSLSDSEYLNLRGYLTDVRDTDALLKNLPGVKAKPEAGPYDKGSDHSFVADIVAQAIVKGGGIESPAASGFRERLSNHARRSTERAAKADARAWRALTAVLPERGEVRVVGSTAGSGGEFEVPAFYTSLYASAARGNRPLGDLLNPMLLPGGISSIHVPRLTTGSATSVQLADGFPLVSQDILTADVTSNVVTIAGHMDVSQQLVDQGPLGADFAFGDLGKAYARNLEAQLLGGTGLNGQTLGVKNVSGIVAANLVAGATATSLQLLWPMLGQAFAGCSNSRLLPPEICLMAGRRWGWIASSLDSSNRPITSPQSFPRQSDFPVAGGYGPVGSVIGVPVWADGSIVAGTTADDILLLRPSDMYLWESTPRLIAAINPLSASLQIRLSLHRYVCFIAGRYPGGVSAVQACPAPANF